MNFTLEDLDNSIKYNFDNYEPHDKQLKFHNFSKDNVERLFLAGNRTGKTYCGCIEDVIHLTGRYPSWWKGHKYTKGITAWVCSPNYEMSRDILQKEILKHLPEGSIVSKARLSGVPNVYDFIQVRHISGEVSTCYFKSYKQGREKFQGSKCDFIHLDEEPPFDIYTECLIRLSNVDSGGQGRLIVTMTPLKGFNQLMNYYLRSDEGKIAPDDSLNSKVYVKAAWKDNPHLDSKTINVLETNLTEYELEARRDGTPYSGSGMVYYHKLTDFVVPPFEIPSFWYKVYGLDVGFTAPTAAVFLTHDRENDVIYLYGEYSQTQLTSIQHSANLIRKNALNMIGYCDPAINHVGQRDGKKQIDDYLSQGLKLKCVKYAKESAVDTINERIRTGRFKVFANCNKTLREYEGYSRDKNGKIDKGDDHLMNALEFVITEGIGYNIYNNPTSSYEREPINKYLSF